MLSHHLMLIIGDEFTIYIKKEEYMVHPSIMECTFGKVIDPLYVPLLVILA